MIAAASLATIISTLVVAAPLGPQMLAAVLIRNSVVAEDRSAAARTSRVDLLRVDGATTGMMSARDVS